jgi:hypothetical protein
VSAVAGCGFCCDQKKKSVNARSLREHGAATHAEAGKVATTSASLILRHTPLVSANISETPQKNTKQEKKEKRKKK